MAADKIANASKTAHDRHLHLEMQKNGDRSGKQEMSLIISEAPSLICQWFGMLTAM
jgi:hypothetical protein